ncbi:MAG: hypothetical protein IJW58_02755 [Clostridia bacterium]|nr:hypothetical protein [Clostridia bacterium]
MLLAKDETLLKEWQYGTTKEGFLGLFGETKKATLTVTDKRIVAGVKSSKRTAYEEVAIKDVTQVSLSQFTPSKQRAYLLIVLGVLQAVSALGILLIPMLLPQQDPSSMGSISGMAVPLLLIAALFILTGIKLLNQGGFTMSLLMKGVETPLLSVGAVSLSGKAKKQGTMKVSVNMESAKEIVETIGALIVENQ